MMNDTKIIHEATDIPSEPKELQEPKPPKEGPKKEGFQFNDPFVNHILFDHANNINDDKAYWFLNCEGNNENQFIDCATPLLGMVLRVRSQQLPHNEIDKLYKQCVDEIKAIEVELVEAKYDYPTIIAYRYVLCTYVDEAIMSTDWGSQSIWSSHSLLTKFHNETWGGEKTFLIIERLEKEIERYYDLLEFIFLCLCLGFAGRYKVQNQGQEKYDKVVANLYEKLKRHKKWEPEPLTKPYINIASTPYFLTRELTVRKVVVSIFIITLVIYLLYSLQLGWKSDAVINELRNIL